LTPGLQGTTTLLFRSVKTFFQNLDTRLKCLAKLNEDRNQVKLKICQKLKEVEKTIGQKLAEKDREIAEYKDKAETRKRNLVSIL
jgi:hypothetical protein